MAYNPDRAFDIYQKVTKQFNDVLRDNLKNEDEETREYVETRILDEYRPWHYLP